MASLEAKLAETVNEAKNLRIALEKEVEERRRDHDLVIKQEEKIKTLCNRVEQLEKEKRQAGAKRWEVWVAIIGGVIALIVAIASYFITHGGKP